jgi:hypothetical protein
LSASSSYTRLGALCHVSVHRDIGLHIPLSVPAEQPLSPPETLGQARPLVMLPARIALLFDSNDHNRRLPLDSPPRSAPAPGGISSVAWP